ncbi:MAG: PilT/PilU family type 4a pilus ATPase [Selenomonadaceae bacterium]|nr:PilT/PilU family type 4a pilus ATPase [Selenomonadaceae bacterium]
MNEIKNFLTQAIDLNVSDLHITADQKSFFRKDGEFFPADEKIISVGVIENFLKEILSEEQFDRLIKQRELDFSIKQDDRRFRVNIYYQREKLSLAFRLIPSKIPTLEELGAPIALKNLIDSTQGLLLVTGRTGSGKSTTLAAFINAIIKNRNCHILTLEDPIEFEHFSENCFISQRELGRDFINFPQALKSALREMPDVLLVGEIRDAETMSMSMEAAAAGIFVLGTLHTAGAAETAMRIESMFPIVQRDSVRDQFADVFTGIFSQQLLKKIGGGRVSATEVLLSTAATKNLIRQGKYVQLPSTMLSGKSIGMQTMQDAVRSLGLKAEG